MATTKKPEQSPFKIWQAIGQLGGGIYSAVQAGKLAKQAKAADEDAKGRRDEAANYYKSLEMSNPFEGMVNQYAGMENKMEDLKVNQQEAEFAAQQFAQSQSNILAGLKGSAGSSGIAALAQSLAQQGQLAAQKSSANIGAQEAANQKAAAQEASNLQTRERSGAAQVAQQIASGEAAYQQRELGKRRDLFQDATKEYNDLRGQAMEAEQAKAEAIGGVIEGGMNIIGTLAGSDRKLKKNIKLIGKSPSGLNIYAFEYINKFFGKGTYQGVMSDEIPTNAVVNNGGYDMVDYSKLDVEFKQI